MEQPIARRKISYLLSAICHHRLAVVGRHRPSSIFVFSRRVHGEFQHRAGEPAASSQGFVKRLHEIIDLSLADHEWRQDFDYVHIMAGNLG